MVMVTLKHRDQFMWPIWLTAFRTDGSPCSYRSSTGIGVTQGILVFKTVLPTLTRARDSTISGTCTFPSGLIVSSHCPTLRPIRTPIKMICTKLCGSVLTAHRQMPTQIPIGFCSDTDTDKMRVSYNVNAP